MKKTEGGAWDLIPKRIIRWKDAIDKRSMLLAFQSFSLQMDAFGELTLTGCQKLNECGESHVGAECSRGPVDLYGEGLRVIACEGGRLIAGGRIAEIHLGGKEEGADA